MSDKRDSGGGSGNAVVYSFYHRWETPLREGSVHVFFRKRFPSRKPSRVYFYIGAPTKSIIGSARVSKMEKLSVEEAVALADQGSISETDLREYLLGRSSVGAIHLDGFSFFQEPVGLDDISRIMVFSPPQNFQSLDIEDEAKLMELAR